MTDDQLLDIVKEVLGEVLPSQCDEFARITRETTVASLDLDSIAVLQCMMAIEARLGVHFEKEELDLVQTFGDLVTLAQKITPNPF